MSQQIDAIYDNGVLKPLVPLSLPDKARVKLTVHAESPTTSEPAAEPEKTPSSDREVLAKQKAALEKLRQEIDKLPQTRNNDGWSVRQHDELLCGGNTLVRKT